MFFSPAFSDPEELLEKEITKELQHYNFVKAF
jgi:hypothetical protein